jgi:hypothetical protein
VTGSRVPLTVERLERALLALAYFMELDGPIYTPLYEKLERELEDMKRSNRTLERARQRLEANRHRLVEFGLKVTK